MKKVKWQPYITVMGSVTQCATGWYDTKGVPFVKVSIQATDITDDDEIVVETSDSPTGCWNRALELKVGEGTFSGHTVATLSATSPDDYSGKLCRWLRWSAKANSTNRIGFKIDLLVADDGGER